MQPTIVGPDLAKVVFQVHRVDERGKVVLTRRRRRDGVLNVLTNLATSQNLMPVAKSAGGVGLSGAHSDVRNIP